ncbi:MAG TPA: HI0074 family nucleotidyltransferase substrate-binding subunit [Dehalococcoidia bacterium]|nr:HI0074 family nucleotidyltransferase substrate-binding subunit [Dehalococcoidia bacterium]
MSDLRLKQFIDDLGNALDRLDEALAGPEDVRAYRDSTILSFTFVYELAWHAMQRLLYLEGVELNTPRSVLQRAYQSHWFDDEQTWLDMAGDRNLVVHTYKEPAAVELYHRIKERHAPELRRLYHTLPERFADLLA